MTNRAASYFKTQDEAQAVRKVVGASYLELAEAMQSCLQRVLVEKLGAELASRARVDLTFDVKGITLVPATKEIV